uniref:Uncharacterized protein n=1 Tax=Plectus sambesii TaxID=2011161 RepID=A0A914VTQ5_9BILA
MLSSDLSAGWTPQSDYSSTTANSILQQAESRCQRQQQPGDPPLSTPLRPPQPPPRRSVRGVVASLIKAAEETHQRAAPLPPPPIPPRVHHIEVNVVAVNGEQQQIVEHLVPQEQQHQSVPSLARSRCSALLDAGTQTSPFSLSRSSSFDWICDPDEEVAMRSAAALRPPHAIDSCSTTSSSTTSGDEALRLLLAAHADDRCTSDEDVEVSETLMRERHIHQHHHRRLFAAEPNGADDVRQREIDDSIAMLLEYSRALGGPAPQLLPPPLASTMSAIGAADEGRLLRGKFDSPTFGDVDRRLRAEASGMPVPRERPSKQHRRTTADGQQSPATTAIPLMNDSLYDNVPELRRHLLVSHQLMQPTVDIWDTENDSIGVLAALSPGEASSAEEFDSTIPRDFSVGSGLLADSESSPLSPENGHIFRSNGEDSALLLTSPDSKSSGDDEQRLHHSVRSPPPPSPLHQRLSTAAIGLMLTPSLDRAGSVDQLDKDNPLASSSQASVPLSSVATCDLCLKRVAFVSIGGGEFIAYFVPTRLRALTALCRTRHDGMGRRNLMATANEWRLRMDGDDELSDRLRSGCAPSRRVASRRQIVNDLASDSSPTSATIVGIVRLATAPADSIALKRNRTLAGRARAWGD